LEDSLCRDRAEEQSIASFDRRSSDLNDVARAQSVKMIAFEVLCSQQHCGELDRVAERGRRFDASRTKCFENVV